MRVLKATQTQYEALNGWKNGHDELLFTKDGNDNWIVGKNVLKNKSFEPIKTELLKLEEITYVAPPSELE